MGETKQFTGFVLIPMTSLLLQVGGQWTPHYTIVKIEDIILPSVLKVRLSFLLMMKEALSMAALLGVLP